MWGWWQTGDNMATLCGGKGKAEKWRGFFYLFFPKKKNLRPSGFDPRSEPPGDCKPNTLTTTPYIPAVNAGSEDPYTRENQIVLFLPLDGSATGPFRWTIPLRLIVPQAAQAILRLTKCLHCTSAFAGVITKFSFFFHLICLERLIWFLFVVLWSFK